MVTVIHSGAEHDDMCRYRPVYVSQSAVTVSGYMARSLSFVPPAALSVSVMISTEIVGAPFWDQGLSLIHI